MDETVVIFVTAGHESGFVSLLAQSMCVWAVVVYIIAVILGCVCVAVSWSGISIDKYDSRSLTYASKAIVYSAIGGFLLGTVLFCVGILIELFAELV